MFPAKAIWEMGRLIVKAIVPLLLCTAAFGFGGDSRSAGLDGERAEAHDSQSPFEENAPHRELVAILDRDAPNPGLERGSSPDRPDSWLLPVRVLKRIGDPAGGLGTVARSLIAFTDATRAPFSRKARVRLSPEALDKVLLGRFRESPPVPDGVLETTVGKSRTVGLRLVAWNIERGLQYEKIAEALKQELAADIYLLQEVDRHARRTEGRDVASSLARELGMHLAFGTEFQELIQGRPGRPAVHGQAILSRFPIRRARVLRFQHQPKDWSRDWFQPRNGGRMALVAEIETPGGSLLVYNVHLESRGNDAGRARQMDEMLDDLQRLDHRGPVLIAGDLNTKEGFDSEVFRLARLGGIERLTFSPPISDKKARHQKDWILASGVGATQTTIVNRVSASDHKPIALELTLN